MPLTVMLLPLLAASYVVVKIQIRLCVNGRLVDSKLTEAQTPSQNKSICAVLQCNLYMFSLAYVSFGFLPNFSNASSILLNSKLASLTQGGALSSSKITDVLQFSHRV